jgi:hypothetical protein
MHRGLARARAEPGFFFPFRSDRFFFHASTSANPRNYTLLVSLDGLKSYTFLRFRWGTNRQRVPSYKLKGLPTACTRKESTLKCKESNQSKAHHSNYYRLIHEVEKKERIRHGLPRESASPRDRSCRWPAERRHHSQSGSPVVAE